MPTARHFSDSLPGADQPLGIPWDAIFTAAADAVVIYDATGRPTWANPAAVGAFSRTMAGRMARGAESPARRALRGETVRGEHAAITDAAGRELAVPVTAVPLRAGDALVGAIVIWHALAEAANRNQHEHGLAVSRRLVEAQEAERRRIARELHDEVGQALTAVKINLQALESQGAGAAPAVGLRLTDSIAVVERALQQVRNISLDLRPSLLDDLGLVSALRWYVDSQAQRAGLAATFTATPPDLRLAADLETDCFRVAQEALTNVIRHARATRVEVGLQSTGHGVRLLIRDNGVGFDVSQALAQAARGKSLGLVGLRERAALAGGRLEIISTRDSGTEVRAWFPAESPEAPR